MRSEGEDERARSYEVLFESMSDAVFIVEQGTGRIIDVNPAAAGMYGYTREEMRGLDATLVSAQPELTARTIRDGQSPQPPRVHKKKDGTHFHVEISTSVTQWNGCTAIIGVVRDVSERRRLEDDLRDSKAVLAYAFQRSPLLMSVADLQTDRYLEVSDSFCACAGYGREEIVGKTAVELGLITAAERDRLAELLMKQVSAGQHLAIEIAFHARSGAQLVCRYWGEVLQTREGPRLFAAAEDVTERKRLEAGLAQNDRLASMGMLAAGVAHEINNPLSYVLANLDMLAGELPKLAGVDPVRLADLIESAEGALEGTRRIRKISRGLGTFARVERVEHNAIDLNAAIETAATMAHNEVKYRATLIKNLGKVPLINGSDGKLAQVFLNLLINAAHAIEEGRAADHSITVRTWARGQDVYAEVSDTGHGIAAANLARVFEPFFTTKQVGLGSGLGLAISRNIITELGGEIGLESEVGHGTRVLIRLPAATSKPAPAPAPAGAEAATPAQAQGRILVVDDEAPIRRVLVRMLGDHHEVLTAASGREGKALIEKDPNFDLVLCDLMMPEMTGMELHAWMVEHAPALAARVVFISGGAFTPAAGDYLSRVGNLKLDKPFERERIVALAAERVAARINTLPLPPRGEGRGEG